MDQDKLNTLFHSTTDEKYKKFLCDRGWEFETDHPAGASHTCVRFVTSWATPPAAVDGLLQAVSALLQPS